MAKAPTIKKAVKPVEEPPEIPSHNRPASAKPQAPGSQAGAAAATMLEFKPADAAEGWRVEKWQLLRADFELGGTAETEEETARWMAFCQGHAKLWLLARRWYGVGPVIPPADALPEDLRPWTREELSADGFHIKEDIEALAQLWGHQVRQVRQVADLGGPGTGVNSQESKQPGELGLDDGLLAEHQFPERLFQIKVYDPLAKGGDGGDVLRPAAENRVEREWFISRVKAWKKMLTHPMGGPVARAALMNELYLRRMEGEISGAPSKAKAALYDQKKVLADDYGRAVDKLQEMFPEMNVGDQVTFRQVLSDVIVGWRDYMADGDHRLIDKVFTMSEIEWQMHASRQGAESYRFSLNLAIVEAQMGLYDPQFRPKFKPSVLKKIEAGFKAAVVAAREAGGEHVVDLEDGVRPGEGDDFEDFLDAKCPHCDTPISSAAGTCPECRRKIRR